MCFVSGLSLFPYPDYYNYFSAQIKIFFYNGSRDVLSLFLVKAAHITFGASGISCTFALVFRKENQDDQ